MGRMATRWKSATESLKPWTTKFTSLMIEWGQNMLDTEKWNDKRRETTTIYNGTEKLQAEAKVYLNAPKQQQQQQQGNGPPF